MLVNEAISIAQRLAGNAVEQSDMLRWLSELDGQIAFEDYQAETWMSYTEDDLSAALLIPFPYDKVYVPHIEAMIYYSRGEYDRYDNSRAMRDTFLGEFRRFVRRTRDCCGRITIAQTNGGNGVTTVSGNDDVWRMVSAYGIAVLHGYTGTEEQWLDEITHYNREAAGDAATSALAAAASASAAESSKTAASNSAWSAAGMAEASRGAADMALESVKNAEAWAVGTRGGVPVADTDPTYHNNAKYWAERFGEELFWCTYGVTTHAEIGNALTAGKLPVCRVYDEDLATNTVYVFSGSYENALDMTTVYELQLAYQDAAEKTMIKGLSCHYDDQWRTFEVELATKAALDTHYVTVGKRPGTSTGSKATAEGENTAAGGYASHAEGKQTTAGGAASHAEGYGTVAASAYQHVFGRCNVPDSASTYVEIVGNGTSTGSQNVSNARTLDWDGNERLAGKLTLGAAPTADMDAATKKYVDDAATGAVSTAIAADNAIYVGADQTAEEIFNAVKTAYFARRMVYSQFTYADETAEGGFRLLTLPLVECEGVTSQTYTRFVFCAAVYNRVYSVAITKSGSSYQRSDVLMRELWQE